jgi:glycyl-tRNA synthetase beta chain
VELSKAAKYEELLSQLAHLREPVDNFFDHVLVMTEDKARRENRLLMLIKLRQLFLHVADIALLQ